MQIKLYTEEQVRKAIELSRVNNFGDDFKRWISHSEPYIIAKLTPIELPSDEEIEKAANDNIWCESEVEFYEGAKWVIEQLKQQDNGK